MMSLWQGKQGLPVATQCGWAWALAQGMLACCSWLVCRTLMRERRWVSDFHWLSWQLMEITFFFLCLSYMKVFVKRTRKHICLFLFNINCWLLILISMLSLFFLGSYESFCTGDEDSEQAAAGPLLQAVLQGSPMSICSRNSEVPKVAGTVSAVCHGSGWSATLTSFRLDEQGIIMTIYQPVSCQAYWHVEDKELREFQIIGRDETQLSIVSVLCKQQHILSLKIWLSTNSTDAKRSNFSLLISRW